MNGVCPICKETGEQNRFWVRCPRFGGSVCERHCSKCRYFSGFATSVVHCFFGRKDAPPKNGGAKQSNTYTR